MWAPGHGQMGWHLAEMAGFKKRDRILCALASMAPDLDGLTFLSGLANYWNFHHTLGHSLFIFPFIAIGIGLCGHHKIQTIIFCLLGSLAHILVDIFGSLPVYLLWPLFPDWTLINNPNPFVIFPVEFATPFLMIGWSLKVYQKRGISILEIFRTTLEGRLYTFLRKIHS